MLDDGYKYADILRRESSLHDEDMQIIFRPAGELVFQWDSERRETCFEVANLDEACAGVKDLMCILQGMGVGVNAVDHIDIRDFMEGRKGCIVTEECGDVEQLSDMADSLCGRLREMAGGRKVSGLFAIGHNMTLCDYNLIADHLEEELQVENGMRAVYDERNEAPGLTVFAVLK